MANVGTINAKGETIEILGIAGTNDNDIVAELQSAERWNEWLVQTTTGVVDVDVSLDGTTFKTAVAMENMHAADPTTRAVVTVATQVFKIVGTFKTIRVRQAGATAAVGTILVGSRSGRG